MKRVGKKKCDQKERNDYEEEKTKEKTVRKGKMRETERERENGEVDQTEDSTLADGGFLCLDTLSIKIYW